MPRLRYRRPDLFVDRLDIKVRRKDCSCGSAFAVSLSLAASSVTSFTSAESDSSAAFLTNVKALCPTNPCSKGVR